MKKVLVFLGKHIWWSVGIPLFCLWKFYPPGWDWLATNADDFMSALYIVAKPILEKLGELWKLYSPFK